MPSEIVTKDQAQMVRVCACVAWRLCCISVCLCIACRCRAATLRLQLDVIWPISGLSFVLCLLLRAACTESACCCAPHILMIIVCRPRSAMLLQPVTRLVTLLCVMMQLGLTTADACVQSMPLMVLSLLLISVGSVGPVAMNATGDPELIAAADRFSAEGAI